MATSKYTHRQAVGRAAAYYRSNPHRFVKDFLHIDCGFLVSLNGKQREERALTSIPSAKTISACKGSNYFWGGSDAAGCFPLLSQGES